MALPDTGAGQLVGYLLAVVLIVIIIYVTFMIFFKAPSVQQIMELVINQGISKILSGIRQSSMSLTTIG